MKIVFGTTKQKMPFRCASTFTGPKRSASTQGMYLPSSTPSETPSAGIIATSVDPGGAYGRFHWIVGQLPNRNSPFPAVAGQRFCFQIGGRGDDGRAVIATGRWFQIVQPGINLSEPHAGERLERGGSKTIRWSAPDLRGGVHIEAYYRRVGGGSLTKYVRLFENTANDGHQGWRIWDRPHGMTGSLDGPPSGGDFRWFIRVLSARCFWLFADGPEFILE